MNTLPKCLLRVAGRPLVSARWPSYRISAWISLLALLIHAAASLAQPAGRQPVKITDGDQPAAVYHMSRSSSGQLLWTAEGLALVYWEGEDVMGDPANAASSRIWLRRWSNHDGWGERERIDRAPLSASAPIGGRHPVAVGYKQSGLETGDLFVAWHDFRNGGINNVEIYGNRRSTSAPFPETDQRLTQSSSAYGGDNGYLPKLAVLPDNRLALTWYDFTWNSSRSEICLWLSNAEGDFIWPGSMDPFRVTVPADRAADDANSFTRQIFSAPAIAADRDGLIHLVWSTGTDNTASRLYYARYNPATSAWIEKRRLKPTPTSAETEFINGGGYFDPAKLIADPIGGGVWLLYTDHTGGNDKVMLRRRPAAASNFEAPIAVGGVGGLGRYPDAAIDASGRVHMVYVNTAGANNTLKYKIYDPATELLSETEMPAFTGGSAVHPAIMLDDQGYAYIVWEEAVGTQQGGDLWFWTTMPVLNGARGWGLYE